MKILPIAEVGHELGLADDELEGYGAGKAKLSLEILRRPARGAGRLVLVSAINPTPAGEGKTTTSIGLAMAMRQRGHKTVLALREPSLGPVFGVKGGGTGGGRASLVPADDINLHFTGDLHAITSAHNLLSALIDNALHFGDTLPTPNAAGELVAKGPLDSRKITWGRALDMNDRALRRGIVGLGGSAVGGMPREERFDITAASEIMAIVALAEGYEDLQARLARIVVGQNVRGETVTAGDLGAAGAMTALLRDALRPNLVQTEEGGPAIVHAGPFANIAHGCNSVLATRMALALGDFAVTEAGFGFDLGGEKFLDIKCRALGTWPRVLVLVATLRALKMHGGVPVKQAAEPNAEALQRGLSHLAKHLENAALFGLPTVVAINAFPNDTEAELAQVEQAAAAFGVQVARSTGFPEGGAGALDLADRVAALAMASDAAPPAAQFAYALEDSPETKIRAIAKKVYGARDVAFTAAARRDLQRANDLGAAGWPVCMAKTQLSLSDDAKKVGRPEGFELTVREVRVAAGAGFLVAITGDMMTMPGLPRIPAARAVRLEPSGRIKGLMQND